MFGSDLPLISNQLPISLDFPDDSQQSKEITQLYLKRIANIVNTKEGALYTLVEVATFQQYFTTDNPQKLRNVYRKSFDMVSLNGGPIAPGALISFPHNIIGITTCTRIFGTATNADTSYIPLPYASTNTNSIVNIFATPTQVVLINGPTQSALSQAYITLEYVKT